MGARDGLQAATRIVIVASITAVMLVAVANPGAACEVHTNTIFFDDVVELDPIGLDVHTFDGAVGVSPVGVVEWRVVAHAPQVPILNSSRHVTLRSRTWGEVPDFDARVQGEFPGFDGRVSRHGGEFFAPLFFLVSWCRFPQVGRTGDVGLTVYANR